MDLENMPTPYLEREVHFEKFIQNVESVLYWGRNKKPNHVAWEEDVEELIPNRINVIEKRKEISVMGSGKDFKEAYHICLSKLEERLDKRGWNFILIGNGIFLKNGANIQYHLGATLHKLDKNYN